MSNKSWPRAVAEGWFLTTVEPDRTPAIDFHGRSHREPGTADHPMVLNPLSGSGVYLVDDSGWCYVTECGGQSSTSGSNFGDSANAGAALASFEVHANNRYTVGNAYGNPALLQAIYGYILDFSNNTATVNGQYEIGNVSGSTPTRAFLSEYLVAKDFP